MRLRYVTGHLGGPVQRGQRRLRVARVLRLFGGRTQALLDPLLARVEGVVGAFAPRMSSSWRVMAAMMTSVASFRSSGVISLS